MRSIPYTITSENLTVVVNGCPVLVAKRAANFAMLRTDLLTEDWEAAANLMKPADAVGGVTVHSIRQNGLVLKKGTTIGLAEVEPVATWPDNQGAVLAGIGHNVLR